MARGHIREKRTCRPALVWRLAALSLLCLLLLCLLLFPTLPARAQNAEFVAPPPEFTPPPVSWLRAESLKGLAPNAPVATWPSSVQGGPDAVQADPAHQPRFLPAGVNGLPAVQFSADQQTFLTLPRPVEDDFTIFCVFQSTQGVGKSDAWRLGAGLVGDRAEVSDEYGVDDYGISLNASGQALGGSGNWDRNLASGSGFNDGKPHMVTLRRVKSLGQIRLFVDGVLVDSFDGANKQPLQSAKELTLGLMGRNSKTLTFLTGAIAEVRFYDEALDGPEMDAVHGVLKLRYNIQAATVPESAVSSVPASARLRPVILPPDPKPAIHGPRVAGASPGKPFLFRVPATGTAPLAFSCADLPPGLKLDPKTGVLSGAVAKAGAYSLHLSVTNAQGAAARVLALTVGKNALALTPPMGWDAINLYADSVDDAHVRQAADALISSGLAAHGYRIINLSDSWQGVRDQNGQILPNRRRFPEMKGLADYVHSKGFGFGLSSSATAHTCAGFPGSLGHAEGDAVTYAEWGVDYLEYTWCPVAEMGDDPPPPDQQAAFRQMHDALGKTSRDVVYAVNTFGRDNAWQWAAEAGANTWVTSRQLFDEWNVLSEALFRAPGLEEPGEQGHWKLPGLLQLGRFGYKDVKMTRLSQAEQMTQMSQFALLSAPLWVSADLSLLDPNSLHPSTTAMLTNDEVLDVDQDPAGLPAVPVLETRTQQVWYKPLADGTVAVGLFNTGGTVTRLRVRLSEIGLGGPQPVRDLWLHQDLGEFSGAFATDVPPHGVALVRIGTKRP